MRALACVSGLIFVMAACSGGSDFGDDGGPDASTADGSGTNETDASSRDGGVESEESSASEGGDGDAGEVGDGDGEAIWTPPPTTTWHWQLTGTVSNEQSVEMVDLDLFDTPQATIDALRDQGIVVICYFSAGSHEDWRPDAMDFPTAGIGEPLDGWPGERWIDHRNLEVRSVMSARMQLAFDKSCDGVEPDNVDGYANVSGFELSAQDQLDYNLFLAYEAHGRGLSIGLKNDLEQVVELEPHFNWALNEECQAWNECDLLDPFIAAGKAVFHVEYVDTADAGPAAAEQVCPPALAKSFSSLVKTWELDAWGLACE